MSIFEDSLLIVSLVAVIGIVAVILGRSTSNNILLRLGGALFVMAGCIWLADRLVVTESEQLRQNVSQLANNFRLKSPATFDAISPNAGGLQAMAKSAMAMVTVGDDLSVTDLSAHRGKNGNDWIVHCRVNATYTIEGYGNVGRRPGRFELTYSRVANDWKVTAVQRLDPITGKPLGLLDAK